jgi:autoinducer 2 (AI-2) kinase
VPSATSVREAIVLYDAGGREVWAVANVYGRAVEELKPRGARVEQRFHDVSGETFALGALPRRNWLRRQRPDIFERVRSFSMINDWISAGLTGEIAVEPLDGPSNGPTNGFIDLATRDGSDALIARAGRDRTRHPRSTW